MSDLGTDLEYFGRGGGGGERVGGHEEFCYRLKYGNLTQLKAALLPQLNNFIKYFVLLFLCYQSNKKHQQKFGYIKITIVLSRKTGI